MARILLIEPDVILANIYSRALAQAGHTVVLAPEAQAAITLADRRAPDLVILELQLAGHNGLEFLYEFRSYPDWQNVPVLINSLVPAEEFSGSFMLRQQLGVSEYFYKPSTSLWQLLHATETYLPAKALGV
jgi:DNA-binding response OmpR family regulator